MSELESFIETLEADDQQFAEWLRSDEDHHAFTVHELILLKVAFKAGWEARYQFDLSNWDGEE